MFTAGLSGKGTGIGDFRLPLQLWVMADTRAYEPIITPGPGPEAQTNYQEGVGYNQGGYENQGYDGQGYGNQNNGGSYGNGSAASGQGGAPPVRAPPAGRRYDSELTPGKLFVGGLDQRTTQETLVQYCSKW